MRNFEVGRSEGAFYFNGLIDEVRLWNTSRTPAEILDNSDATLSGVESGLVGYWPFDEGAGPTTADLTANANTGSLGGGVASQLPAWSQVQTNVDIELFAGGFADLDHRVRRVQRWTISLGDSRRHDTGRRLSHSRID